MLQVIKADQHYKGQYDWLTTYHHFSFGEYYNPEKMSFGPLRVFNDDIVQPGTGFDFHPHNNMEIITYLIDGELEHKDNFGNHGIIKPGEIQRMSAGSGITHAEYNHSKEKPLRLLQMWVLANKKNLKPSWEQHRFTKQQQLNKLLPVIVPENYENSEALKIHQDALFYLSTITPQNTVQHTVKEGRMAYVFVIDGQAKLNGRTLQTRDAVMVKNENSISISANTKTELILVDLPEKFVFNQ
ncbi:MAG: pirin family protein [Thaumarchaeota archaeon]|nr:pirin family protein [Nitrososphaerota archaeon]